MKVVLLLDNAPSHPSLDELNAVNENVEVIYLPPNVTALTQHMDQGVIAIVKKLYKKNLLRHLLLGRKPEGAVKFLHDLNLRDCCAMLRLAWDSVHQSTLQKAWKSLLGDSFIPSNVQDPSCNIDANGNELDLQTDSPSSTSEICDRVSQILSGPNYSVEESRKFLLEWLENDHTDTDCGWEPLSDGDIVNFVRNGTCQPEPVNKMEESETTFQNPDRMEITSTEIFEYLVKIKSWMESRPEFSSIHLHQVEELENIIRSNMPETSQNKVYFRL